MKYQIGIPCGANSQSYLLFLIDSIKKCTPDINSFEILLGIDNNSISSEALSQIKDKIPNIKTLSLQTKGTLSLGHGDILDQMLPHFSSKFSVFIDCDSAILINNWLEVLSSNLKGNKIIIGSEYEEGSGKYLKFPNAIFMLFNTKIFKSLDISFKPSSPPRDVGWEMPVKIKAAGYDGIPLDLISPRQEKTQSLMKFMTEDMRGEEYQLNGIPICTHVGRSSSRDFNDPIVKKWATRVNQWVDQINT